ncbi:hypothetical protein BCR44DRAFT_44762 [Catenaria anguillulae PL171]|uniref:Actin cytoskeleton-regulatory complex protein SLA1 n=1 Tax=Catenaria anguillulae PL171 TaxID=765915 RepID=A0A1Y2HYC9_9FUNG|nr:hypothetical protein BCR44DRAFT_44762 [Catenaria anguillulae PL171]
MNRIVQAVYDYDAQQDDELTIREGHLLWLGADASDEPGWLKCTLKTFADAAADAVPDQVGNVPENYVDEPVALYHAVALYDYDPQADDELQVYENSPLDILLECPDGEWVVARMPTDQGNYYGLVPKSYIEPTTSSSDPGAAAAAAAAIAAPAPAPVAPVTQTPPPKTPQPTTTSTVPLGPPRIATALYDYDPQQDDELDIKEGETCMILVDAESDPTADPDWSLVRLVSSKPDRSGKEGLVPMNYLEIKTISKSPAAMLTSSPAAAAAAAAATSAAKAPPLPPQPTAIPPAHTQVHSPMANGQAATPPPLPPTPSANAQRDAQLQLERERAERERQERERAERERAAAVAAEQEAQRRKQQQQQQDEMDAYQRQLAAEEERARQRREEERIKQEEAERQRAVTAAATAAANAKPPGLPPRPPTLPDRPTPAAVSRVATANAVSVQNTGSSAASSSDRPDPAQVRVWLDASGIHKTEAAFLDLVDGKVKLFKTNGVKIDVPITALSPQDQATAYKLKGLPVPAHLSGDPPAARGTSPALPSPRAASAPMTNGPTTYNGMDWSDFLVSAGVEAGEARTVAQRFAAEKLDESTVPDLSRDILKGLGVREGDILRILKYVSTYRTKREREQALEAENLARIESYAKSRGGAMGGLTAGMASMSVGGAGRGGVDQLKEDEELARRLQQEELLRAGVSSTPIPPTAQTRKEAPPAAARRTQPAHPAATTLSSTSSSSNMSAALAARRQSAPQSPVTSNATGSMPGINPRMGAPPPMPSIAQAVSAVPSHTLQQQQQPMRPAAPVSLPAPLIPTNTSAGFVPTAVTGPTLAQQQQMQAQQLAQQQMLMQQQQQQQMQAQNQANMMMLASAMMSGQRPTAPQGVASNATGRAQWQNATPDNPFGKPLAPTATGSSSLSTPSMGMSRSISQPAYMSTMSTGASTGTMNPAMLAGAGGAAMQFAHQNPAMAQMMVQQGVGFAQQNPQLMHQAAGMAVQHGPGMVHAGSGMLAASVRPGMPGMQGPMGMQQGQFGMQQGQGQQQPQMDQYAAFRQFQGQR